MAAWPCASSGNGRGGMVENRGEMKAAASAQRERKKRKEKKEEVGLARLRYRCLHLLPHLC